MTIAIQVQNTINIGGKALAENYSKTAGASTIREFDVPAAKAGTLPTRTSDTVGTLTMAAGHGLATADVIDIFWNVGGVPGHRRGVTVGTVAVNSVPITGGTGDVLPIATSVISAMVPVQKEFRVDGDDLIALAGTAVEQGVIKFTGDDDVEDFAMIITSNGKIGSGAWVSGNGVANPVAGDVITKVQLSHAGLASKKMTVVAAYD